MGNEDNFRDKVRRVIGDSVSSYSFSLNDIDEWKRKHGWKTDLVDLGFKDVYFFINVYVTLPPEPGTRFDFETLAMLNLPTLCGSSDAVYRYPSFGQTSRLLVRIEDELEQGMAWFETLSSPESCLKYLLTDTKANPESSGYKYRESYLRVQIAIQSKQ